MKPSDINILPEIGQYWLLPRSDVPSRVIDIENGLVRFDDNYVAPLPFEGGFVYLWYICELYITNFNKVIPKPGQIWVNDSSQNIFFIHPSQESCEEKMFRVLSDSSNIDGSSSLFRECNLSE